MQRPGRAVIMALAVLLVGGLWAGLNHFREDPVCLLLEYYPLAHGSWWEYGVEGAAFDALVARAEAVPEPNGQNPAYLMEIVIPESDTIWHRAEYTVDSHGIMVQSLTWEERGTDYVQISPGYILMAPLEGDHNWCWETGFSDSEGNDHDLLLRAEFRIEGREDVEVPAGLFQDCLKVVRENRFRQGDEWYRVKQVLWYAPGVGLVLEEHHADGELLGRCYLTDWEQPE